MSTAWWRMFVGPMTGVVCITIINSQMLGVTINELHQAEKHHRIELEGIRKQNEELKQLVVDLSQKVEHKPQRKWWFW